MDAQKAAYWLTDIDGEQVVFDPTGKREDFLCGFRSLEKKLMVDWRGQSDFYGKFLASDLYNNWLKQEYSGENRFISKWKLKKKTEV